MDPKDFSRREFLKAFAALSSAPLLLSIQTACAAYGPGPVYGPAPINDPLVSGMYFLDAQLRTVLFENNQTGVPLSTKFSIEFTKDMNMSFLPTVFLTGPNDTPVELISEVWDTARLLTLNPAADLAQDTTYTLQLGNDAEDTNGNKIYLTGSATAAFKTVAA